MSPFFELSNEIPDTDIFTKGAEAAELPSVGTLFLGVFVTLLPKVGKILSFSQEISRIITAGTETSAHVRIGQISRDKIKIC